MKTLGEVKNLIFEKLIKNIRLRSGKQCSRKAAIAVKDIPISDIQIISNIRKDYTGITELAESLREHGLLQPITAYALKDGYAVKIGHRRLLAYKMLHQKEPEKFNNIRCIISDEKNAALNQLIENVQRADLSQMELLNALNELRQQGMPLKQIGQVAGKTEGYIKSLFVGVNEINRDEKLKNLIGDAGITIRDIAETRAVKDSEQRALLLEERKSGKLNRAEMRDKVRELSAPKKKEGAQGKPSKKEESNRIILSIVPFPAMNKIVIYQACDGNSKNLHSLEYDLRAYFSANKEKYGIKKASAKKEGLLCDNTP